ncbi:PAS domain-containing protein [Nocardiopsis sp. ARC36]
MTHPSQDDPTDEHPDQEDEHLIREAERIAVAIGRMFPGLCEVVLHDLRRPDSAIRVIENNLSGRQVGDSATELGLRRIEDPDYPSVIQNYSNRFPDGRPAKSTSIGIKNADGRYVAALCLNLDVSTLSPLALTLANLVATDGEHRGEGLETLLDRTGANSGRPSTPSPPSAPAPPAASTATRSANWSGSCVERGSSRPAVPHSSSPTGSASPGRPSTTTRSSHPGCGRSPRRGRCGLPGGRSARRHPRAALHWTPCGHGRTAPASRADRKGRGLSEGPAKMAVAASAAPGGGPTTDPDTREPPMPGRLTPARFVDLYDLGARPHILAYRTSVGDRRTPGVADRGRAPRPVRSPQPRLRLPHHAGGSGRAARAPGLPGGARVPGAAAPLRQRVRHPARGPGLPCRAGRGPGAARTGRGRARGVGGQAVVGWAGDTGVGGLAPEVLGAVAVLQAAGHAPVDWTAVGNPGASTWSRAAAPVRVPRRGPTLAAEDGGWFTAEVGAYAEALRAAGWQVEADTGRCAHVRVPGSGRE